MPSQKPRKPTQPPHRTQARPSAVVETQTEVASISDVLLELSAPLFGGRHGDALSDDELTLGLSVARMAWNASIPGEDTRHVQWARDALLEHLGPEKWAEMRPHFDQMLALRLGRYGPDPRVIVSFELVHTPGGRRLNVTTALLKKKAT